MQKGTIALLILMVSMGGLFSQTSAQKGVAQILKAVNPSYVAAYGLGQVMDKNLDAMASHWRATRAAIENTGNYVNGKRINETRPFSFIKYEPDRQRIIRHLGDMEYYSRLIKQTYDKREIDSYAKEIARKQKLINDICITYRGKPLFVDGSNGVWSKTRHVHKCTHRHICKAYEIDLAFSKTSDGKLKISWPNYHLLGTLSGGVYTFKMYHNGRDHGEGRFTFDRAMTRFSGNWKDKYGHWGTWSGEKY